MANIYKSKDFGYVCEIWGASTKHPDSIFYFSNFKKTDLWSDEAQVFQWLLECASKMTWPMHARELVDQAIKDWYPLDKDWKVPEVPEWTKDHWHPNYR